MEESSSFQVPVIDMSPFVNEYAYDDSARLAVAKQWDQAMSEIGFCIVQGHGVPEATVTALREAAMCFFSKDASFKSKYNFGPYGNPFGGYTAVGTEAVSRSRDAHGSDGGGAAGNGVVDDDDVEAKAENNGVIVSASSSSSTVKQKTTMAMAADPVESFVFKPQETTKPKPPGLEGAATAYHAEMLRVLGCLHHLTAASLGLPRDFFDPYYEPYPDVFLRLAYYPPLEEQAATTTATNAKGSPTALRYGEHTDYTGFTILLQDDSDAGLSSSTDDNSYYGAGGLQVRSLKTGKWHSVLPRKNTFCINIGDLYQVWTNGRWKSTVHRVLSPSRGSAAAAEPRFSVPFFTGPHGDAMIQALPTCVTPNNPARYAPIKARDHLLKKLGASNV